MAESLSVGVFKLLKLLLTAPHLQDGCRALPLNGCLSLFGDGHDVVASQAQHTRLHKYRGSDIATDRANGGTHHSDRNQKLTGHAAIGRCSGTQGGSAQLLSVGIMPNLTSSETVCGESRFKDGVGHRPWAHLAQDATHSNLVGNDGNHS